MILSKSHCPSSSHLWEEIKLQEAAHIFVPKSIFQKECVVNREREGERLNKHKRCVDQKHQ